MQIQEDVEQFQVLYQVEREPQPVNHGTPGRGPATQTLCKNIQSHHCKVNQTEM